MTTTTQPFRLLSAAEAWESFDLAAMKWLGLTREQAIAEIRKGVQSELDQELLLALDLLEPRS
jgi:hypothetical protein